MCNRLAVNGAGREASLWWLGFSKRPKTLEAGKQGQIQGLGFLKLSQFGGSPLRKKNTKV